MSKLPISSVLSKYQTCLFLEMVQLDTELFIQGLNGLVDSAAPVLTECSLHWTEEGVKMENQNEPLLIRPSGTPKTNTKRNFCPQSFPTIGTSTWLYSCDFSCDFSKILHNLHKTSLILQKLIWLEHGSIHLSLTSPALGFVWLLSSFCDKFRIFCTNFANTHKKSHTKTMCWRP